MTGGCRMPTEIRRLGAQRGAYRVGRRARQRVPQRLSAPALPLRRVPRASGAHACRSSTRARASSIRCRSASSAAMRSAFKWSDGHDTGIYSYQTLRALCPCAALRKPRRAAAVVMTARRRRARAADGDPSGRTESRHRRGRPGARRRVCADGVVTVQLMPGPLPPPIVDATVADIRRAVGALRRRDARRRAARARTGRGRARSRSPGVGDIIAVSSTKGGVGKSTVAVNLAAARCDARASASACSTPTSTARACRRCSACRAAAGDRREQDPPAREVRPAA